MAFQECDRCKQPLRIVRTKDREVSYDRDSEYRHVCWNLPEDANLLVLED